MRALGAAVLALVLLVGGGYAAYAWTQSQFYVGVNDGRVTVFKGVDQTFGPIDLSSPETMSGIVVEDLPDFYRAQAARGITMKTRSDAAALVRNLEVQAGACRYAKSQGRDCATVPSTWTTPTPTPTPTPSSSAPATPVPTPTSTVRPTPTVSPNA